MLIDTQLIIYGNITDIFSGKRSFIKLETLEYGTIKIKTSKKILTGLEVSNTCIGINIEAKQDLTTKKLSNIKAVSITKYSDKYDPEKMAELIRKGTEAWKDVKDINKWLREIRGFD